MAVQGKSIARWRRKARDLGSYFRRKTARPPDQVRTTAHEGDFVKANLARFTMALMLLATMAMSLGAGMRWWFE
jgi:hypothetical protein